jgi:ketosteroid isomerase-like protein
MIINYPNYIMIFTGFTLLTGLYCCSPGSNEQADNAVSEVRDREIAFAGTMEDRDFDTFLTFISPEAVFFSGNDPRRGHDAISKAWAPDCDGEKAPFSWQPDVIEVLESGRLALSSGPVLDASGKLIGRFNSIWRKDEDGQWRVIFDKGS